MRTIQIATFVLLAFFVFQAGCSSTGHHAQTAASRRSVQNQSGSVRSPYELPSGAKHLSLSLTLSASAGSLVYTLTDPRGTPAWQGRVDAGQKLNESRTLKPLPGKWVLALAMQNATGSYDITWNSK